MKFICRDHQNSFIKVNVGSIIAFIVIRVIFRSFLDYSSVLRFIEFVTPTCLKISALGSVLDTRSFNKSLKYVNNFLNM